MRFLILFVFIFNSFLAQAQLLDPVKWTFSLETLGNDEYTLSFEATMEKEWTVYSQYTSDDGPVPTYITYEPETGFQKVGKAEEFGHKKSGMDKLFGVEVIKFLADEPFTIKQKVRAEKGTRLLKGYLTYMTCNDEMCLPPTDVDFEFKLPVTSEIKDTPKPKTNQKTPEIENKIISPVKWNFEILALDEGFELRQIATIEKGWTVYSQMSSRNGPVPTEITFEDREAFTAFKTDEVGSRKRRPDPFFNNVMVIKYYSDQPYTIRQKIIAHNNNPIKGYVTFMACNNEGCLPPTDVDFEYDLLTLTGKEVKNKFTGTTITETIDYDTPNADVSDAVNTGSSVEDVSIGNAPAGDNGFIDQKIASITKTFADPIGNCIGGEENGNRTFLMSFIFGFLGGLLALLTPCVFPMIPLTVSFFTKDTKRKGWVNGLIYGLSIIVIYVALGLLLTAVFGPEALNRLSTNWIANTLFFLIFVGFAFSFFGYYEITLPSSWSTKSDTMADKGGILGIFFMAFTLALVSFSCTGPIIGSAIVSAASNAVGPAIVMLGFAIALALPFGLFAAFPAWLNTLPQSGGWMNSVKVVLGFLELALAFKFLSVADMTNHWGFLKYELFMGTWILISLLMALYLFGVIKFPHDSPMKKLSIPRATLAVATSLFTVYLATGFFVNEKTGNYNSLGVMSGLAPPAHYNFFKPAQEVDPEIKKQFPSYTMCANNIPCFKDYYEGLEYARSVNKPIFKDFTGFGCVNCRKVEEHIWVRDEIRDKLINDFVLVSLYVDDDKKLETIGVSKRDSSSRIRNVGNRWADFQIVNYNQNTQPLYVMMTPDEKVIAKPRGYRQNEGVKEYNDYMECGLATFNKLK